MLNVQPARDRIELSSAILDFLPKLPASALKVYVFLCSIHEKSITATIATIGQASGVRRRATSAALKLLTDKKLITIEDHRGNQPNEYLVTYPSAGAPNRSKIVTASLPAPIIGSRDGSAERAMISEPSPTIDALIAECYRPINASELAQVWAWIPDSTILRQTLAQAKLEGGVAQYMSLDFFGRVLKTMASK